MPLKYDLVFQYIGFQENHLIRGCDLGGADDIKAKNRDDLIALTKATAEKLIR